jgi:hypothetical protein
MSPCAKREEAKKDIPYMVLPLLPSCSLRSISTIAIRLPSPKPSLCLPTDPEAFTMNQAGFMVNVFVTDEEAREYRETMQQNKLLMARSVLFIFLCVLMTDHFPSRQPRRRDSQGTSCSETARKPENGGTEVVGKQ